MTFMSDIRNGVVRIVERDEHRAAIAEWARLQQDEADNFESDQRWADNDGISFNIFNAQVVA